MVDDLWGFCGAIASIAGDEGLGMNMKVGVWYLIIGACVFGDICIGGGGC